MAIEVGDVPFADLRDYVERTFRPVAETKGLELSVELDPRPAAVDLHRREAAAAGPAEPAVQRLQVHRGGPGRRCGSALATERLERRPPDRSTGRAVVAFSVSDTGHRHPAATSCRVIFEPFQQADTGDQPEVRRHRPGPVDQPGDRPAARRRDPGPEHASARGAPSPSTCRWTTSRSRRPPASRRAARPAARAAPAPPEPSPRRSATAARRRVRPRPRSAATTRRDRARRPGDPDRRARAPVRRDPAGQGPRDGLQGRDHARTARSALELAHEIQPAAITLDLRLPDMDGWVVLDRLKHDPAPATSPSTSSRSTTAGSAG